MPFKPLYTNTNKGMVVSIGCHLLLLLAMYGMQLLPNQVGGAASSYAIAVQFSHRDGVYGSNASIAEKPLGEPTEPLEDVLSVPALSAKKQHLSKQRRNGRAARKVSSKAVGPNKVPCIDKRALYPAKKAKQGQAILELAGWEWDVVPNPEDSTEEAGKIVFEIKVDINGDIVYIKTLEKTVPPIVEKIYLDALRGLTFSKTSDSDVHAPCSTGKVTFILVSK